MTWSLQFLGYVFENLKFKISEGYKLNWDSQQGRDRKTSILVLAFWNFKLKVLKYQWNFRPHATVIWNLVKPLIIYFLQVSQNFPPRNLAVFGMKQKKCNIFSVVTHNHLFTPTFAAIFTRKSFSCENGQVEQHNALWCDKASFEIFSPSQEQKMVCTD